MITLFFIGTLNVSIGNINRCWPIMLQDSSHLPECYQTISFTHTHTSSTLFFSYLIEFHRLTLTRVSRRHQSIFGVCGNWILNVSIGNINRCWPIKLQDSSHLPECYQPISFTHTHTSSTLFFSFLIEFHRLTPQTHTHTSFM